MSRWHETTAIAALAIAPLGCGDAGGDGAARLAPVSAQATFEAREDGEPVVLATPRQVEKGDGLRVEVLADGRGALIDARTTALVRFRARVDGAEADFASSDGWYEPLAVAPASPAGGAGVVAGLRRGVEGLHVGSRARIVVPPALGYGSAGLADSGIPADATLAFEVEVVGAR